MVYLTICQHNRKVLIYRQALSYFALGLRRFLFAPVLALTIVLAPLTAPHLHAEEPPELLKKEQVSAKPKMSIPTLPKRSAQKAEIVNGKVLIKRVELKGDSLFPEYGITQQFISNTLKSAFKNMNSWMSIADMHSLSDTLTIAYHSKGLTFNQVFVVPNEIRDNTLILNIITGRVSEIHLKNNKLYSEKLIKEPFMHLLGKVVYEPDIQVAMKKANQTPGLKVFGFFSVGKYPGQTRLNLHVVNETEHEYAVRVDNFGVSNTGELRVIGSYAHNNITGSSDTLHGTLISTNELGNFYGALSYQRPHGEQSNYGFNLYSNQFEVFGDFESIGLTGHLESISGFYASTLLKENNAMAELRFSGSAKHSQVSADDVFDDVFGETIDYVTVNSQFSASVIPPQAHRKQSFKASLIIGSILDTNSEILDSTFTVLNVGYGHEWRWIAGNPAEMVTGISANVYYTPNEIPSSERSVMTGPYGVRSYSTGIFGADSIYSVNAQHSLRYFQVFDGLTALPFGFADYSYGTRNDEAANDASFLGVGLGVDLYYKDYVKSKFTLGLPIAESSSQALAEEPDSITIYGYISINF